MFIFVNLIQCILYSRNSWAPASQTAVKFLKLMLLKNKNFVCKNLSCDECLEKIKKKCILFLFCFRKLLLYEHVLCKECVVITKKWDFETLTHLFVLWYPDFNLCNFYGSVWIYVYVCTRR